MGDEFTAKHGTTTGYRAGCRCDACRTADTAYRRQWREKRKSKAMPEDLRHGTANAYTNWSCRCIRCREWSRQEKQARRGKAEGGFSHGTLNGYDMHGCRCNACVDANARHKARYFQAAQTATLPQATRRGSVWTGPELEVACRDDLTATEAALLLGRTAAAVGRMRRQVRIDPRYARLAGRAS